MSGLSANHGLLALALVAVVGCGSGGDTHAFQAVHDCLKAKPPSGFTFTTGRENVDLIAAQAGQGAVQLNAAGQEIAVVVERSSKDAGNTKRNYEAFGTTVEQRGNVVVSYAKTPTDEEKNAVDACL